MGGSRCPIFSSSRVKEKVDKIFKPFKKLKTKIPPIYYKNSIFGNSDDTKIGKINLCKKNSIFGISDDNG
jgi:hypothetical protein